MMSIIRSLLIAGLFFLLYQILSRLLGRFLPPLVRRDGSRPPQEPSGFPPPPGRESDQKEKKTALVQCAWCDTWIHPSDAVRRQGHPFCNDQCADQSEHS